MAEAEQLELFTGLETVQDVAYRCEECKGLSEDEPQPVAVRDWDGAHGHWTTRVARLCGTCRARTKVAYRRNDGGFIR